MIAAQTPAWALTSVAPSLALSLSIAFASIIEDRRNQRASLRIFGSSRNSGIVRRLQGQERGTAPAIQRIVPRASRPPNAPHWTASAWRRARGPGMERDGQEHRRGACSTHWPGSSPRGRRARVKRQVSRWPATCVDCPRTGRESRRDERIVCDSQLYPHILQSCARVWIVKSDQSTPGS
jgi:hypothetical protein